MRPLTRLRHARFLIFLAVFAIAAAVAGSLVGLTHGLILGFDLAAVVFVLLTFSLMARAAPDQMRAHAAQNDGGRLTTLTIAAAAVLVVLTTVGLELAAVDSAVEVVAAFASLLLAGLFGNLLFALHYAHLYYDQRAQGDDQRGLVFPGTDTPDYWDFCYFAATLGMAFQVSDVAVTDPRLRRTVTLHALAAFLYSIGALSLTINIVAGGT